MCRCDYHPKTNIMRNRMAQLKERRIGHYVEPLRLRYPLRVFNYHNTEINFTSKKCF